MKAHPPPGPKPSQRAKRLTILPGSDAPAGFTRLDLLATLMAVGTFLLLATPLTAGNRTHGRLATCLDQMLRLQRAWTLYANDYSGRLVACAEGSGPASEVGPSWDNNSFLDYASSNADNWDTNLFPVGSPLWPYLEGDTSVGRCPEDPSQVRPDFGRERGNLVPRTRSRTINGWVGGNVAWLEGGKPWRSMYTLDAFVDPGPARTFTFIDEREDSIIDGAMLVGMQGFSAEGPGSPLQFRLVDYPADWHDQGASVAYADGHLETHRWRDPRTLPRHSLMLPLNLPSPSNPDVAWLQERTTRARP